MFSKYFLLKFLFFIISIKYLFLFIFFLKRIKTQTKFANKRF